VTPDEITVAGARPRLSALSERQRQEALGRFVLLRPCLEDGVPVTQVAREHGVAPRTVERWLDRYRAHGLTGLARQARADRHRRRFPDELLRLVEGLALRTPPPTVAAVHRRAVAVARQRAWPVPSYGTVYAVIRRLEPALKPVMYFGVAGLAYGCRPAPLSPVPE
jgi:putative transposase